MRSFNILIKAAPILLALLGMFVPATAGWTQRQKITSTPRGVGARFDSTTASQAGAAFVYDLSGSTWTQ